jgi:hypothetical protein
MRKEDCKLYVNIHFEIFIAISSNVLSTYSDKLNERMLLCETRF